MERSAALNILKQVADEILLPDGRSKWEAFAGLREVDAKIRDVRHVISSVDGLPVNMVYQFDNDVDFQAQSRRVRLEALATHIASAQRFLGAAAPVKPNREIIAPPNTSKLTQTIPDLEAAVHRRWREAQKCVYVECYTSAIIMMGSILEALLLARATIGSTTAYQSAKAPKDRNGRTPAVQDWSLNALVDVAVDVQWLKTDRGKFGHALREARNVVHPWVEVSTRANFDEATCRTSWEVLRASVDDLLKSL